uniref:Uncharacterized protein n=1 Tax=Glossina pallidipes TaxID=7398 RepID=A0A1A9Z4S9_GLOPL
MLLVDGDNNGATNEVESFWPTREVFVDLDLFCEVVKGEGVDTIGVRKPSLVVAKRRAAGDMEASRSILDRINGDAILRRAVSIAFCFCALIFSPIFSAKAKAIFSRLDVSLILNDGPALERTGVSEPSKRKGVPSISPQVIRGEKASPGLGDGAASGSNIYESQTTCRQWYTVISLWISRGPKSICATGCAQAPTLYFILDGRMVRCSLNLPQACNMLSSKRAVAIDVPHVIAQQLLDHYVVWTNQSPMAVSDQQNDME